MDFEQEKRAGIAQMQAECTKAEAPVRLRSMSTNDDIIQYHQPGPTDVLKIANVRVAALNFLNVIDANCPPCADSSDARRKVREAMMTANASIVLKGAV